MAVLEALMGADAREIIDDCMFTFCNYYGIDASMPQYEQVASCNIVRHPEKAFGLESLTGDGADLSSCAGTYLEGIGMTPEEIDSLVKKLSDDHGAWKQAKRWEYAIRAIPYAFLLPFSTFLYDKACPKEKINV